jgi:NAD(P)-dependent dehydrogenase (short-subunit alcohol dehydrogenase family)
VTAVDPWRLADIPDQAGRTVVVTGTSVGGIGHATALELARRGARVVLAGRTPAKLAETRAAIVADVPHAALEELEVDLASLASVRAAAASAQELGPLDVLVNNAGVMASPRRSTEDGFDLQLATNHLGPFLLTGLLLPQLLASKAARVVTVSSLVHKTARRAPTSFAPPGGLYRKWQVYGQSKLANLLFTHELERRAREKELPLSALAAHPGFSGTHLVANGQLARSSGGVASILDAAVKAVSQPAAHGAWPVLMAATADLPGATYVGPGGLGEVAGAPQVVTSSGLSRDPEAARRLWALSEDATGIRYP